MHPKSKPSIICYIFVFEYVNFVADFINTNTFEIYDSVVSSGSVNTYTLEKLVQTIAADKVDNGGFFQDVKVLKKELVDEAMLAKVNNLYNSFSLILS